jgi:hypothetical protein
MSKVYRERCLVRLDVTRISPFGTTWRRPSRSRRTVVRSDTSSTVPLTAPCLHDVPHVIVVLHQQEEPRDEVADQCLGPEPEGHPAHAGRRHQGPDVHADLAQHHHQRDDPDAHGGPGAEQPSQGLGPLHPQEGCGVGHRAADAADEPGHQEADRPSGQERRHQGGRHARKHPGVGRHGVLAIGPGPDRQTGWVPGVPTGSIRAAGPGPAASGRGFDRPQPNRAARNRYSRGKEPWRRAGRTIQPGA